MVDCVLKHRYPAVWVRGWCAALRCLMPSTWCQGLVNVNVVKTAKGLILARAKDGRRKAEVNK